MFYEGEKDYIMRVIKESVRLLVTMLYGKADVSLETEKETKFQVSGKPLRELLEMIDKGQINEAENLLLEEPDYQDREQVAAGALFYQYLSKKEEDFLEAHDYSLEEIQEGFTSLLEDAGYGEIVGMMK